MIAAISGDPLLVFITWFQLHDWHSSFVVSQASSSSLVQRYRYYYFRFGECTLLHVWFWKLSWVQCSSFPTQPQRRRSESSIGTLRDMAGSPVIALYITICCLAFVMSKIIISFLLYKRWARKRRIIEDSLSGQSRLGNSVIERSTLLNVKQSTDLPFSRRKNGGVQVSSSTISEFQGFYEEDDEVIKQGHNRIRRLRHRLQVDRRRKDCVRCKEIEQGKQRHRPWIWKRAAGHGWHKAQEHCQSPWVLHCSTV